MSDKVQTGKDILRINHHHLNTDLLLICHRLPLWACFHGTNSCLNTAFTLLLHHNFLHWKDSLKHWSLYYAEVKENSNYLSSPYSMLYASDICSLEVIILTGCCEMPFLLWNQRSWSQINTRHWAALSRDLLLCLCFPKNSRTPKTLKLNFWMPQNHK